METIIRTGIVLSGLPVLAIYLYVLGPRYATSTSEITLVLFAAIGLILLVLVPFIFSRLLSRKNIQFSDSSFNPAEDHVVYAKVVLWLLITLIVFGPYIFIYLHNLFF